MTALDQQANKPVEDRKYLFQKTLFDFSQLSQAEVVSSLVLEKAYTVFFP